MGKKLTHADFIAKVKLFRGNTLKVVSEYTGIQCTVECVCTGCGDRTPWKTRARNLLVVTSCPHKNGHKKLSHEAYKLKVAEVSAGTIIPVSKYIDSTKKVQHKCNPCICGKPEKWECLPQNLLYYSFGCPKASPVRKRLRTSEKYLTVAKTFSLEPCGAMLNMHVKQKHKCLICGEIVDILPRVLLYNKPQPGCSNCREKKVVKRYSKVAIKWMESIEKDEHIKIRHAENLGEYNIPGTKFKVDGFCKETNTVYEFYGDCWHGNPKVHKPNSRPHPYTNLTASQLYKQTMLREKLIKEKGYEVVSLWESDYHG